ncbi:NAD(P)-dependent oxidoreductase [Streptosporangium sp. CA-135522]|uniref:NAD(P)-dependent oxidoreductase n=1 Tax=Streptosporangium sp. CA-135522 TaxID=3240072 RepID=UPI003D8AF7E4
MASIAVVAATGRTGRIIVEQALAAGHAVTAIARRPQALGLDHPRLTPHAADVLRPGSLEGVLTGHDAVISALGATGRGPTTVYSAGTAAIVSAMAPVRRLIVLSSAGLAVPADAAAGARLFGRVLHRVMRHPYADMARMERLLAATDLYWTAVRPTGLNDGPAGGHPRVSIGAARTVGPRTSRADLAAYILGRIDDPATYRVPVAVSS